VEHDDVSILEVVAAADGGSAQVLPACLVMIR
jgi:hypothetical protein